MLNFRKHYAKPILGLLFTFFLWSAWQRQHLARYSGDAGGNDAGLVNSGPRIAKVSVAINELNSSLISRALKSHDVQNKMHGYQHFIGTKPLVYEAPDPEGRPLGTWSKPAYLLSLLLTEIQKPADERLQWLFWVDADTIIMNPHIRLESFLPPDNPKFQDIHLLLTENWDGINAGVFPIRVHEWSVGFLSACISYAQFHPDEFLQFRDQTAMSNILHFNPTFQQNWTVVPHRWFNSFPVNSTFSENGTWIYATAMTPDEFDDGEEVQNTQPWKVLKGDMLVHFAGAKQRQSWMDPWAIRAEMYLPEWSGSTYNDRLLIAADEFWKGEKARMAANRKSKVEEEEKRKNEDEARAKEEAENRQRYEVEKEMQDMEIKMAQEDQLMKWQQKAAFDEEFKKQQAEVIKKLEKDLSKYEHQQETTSPGMEDDAP